VSGTGTKTGTGKGTGTEWDRFFGVRSLER